MSTTIPGIVVTGQRRPPNSAVPFPGRGGGGSPPDQEMPGVDKPPVEDGGSPDPCADPVHKKIWNADATAAAAVAALMAKAASLNAGANLSNREFGANLIAGPNGQVSLQSNISVGDPAVPGQVPNVSIDMTGVTLANWMGDIHNHPSGDGRLSGDEWNAFINFMSSISAAHPERSAELPFISVYFVVLDGSAPGGYRIYAYNRDSPPDQTGNEVNPNAQPCPNA